MYNAQWFFNEFKSKVNENTIPLDSYKYGRRFTSIVTDKIIEILESIGLQWNKEYFRIDVAGWEDRKNDITAYGKELNHHLWDLKIAVEHENKNNDWTDELVKLIHIRCPLKVIIGYNSYDNRNDLEKLRIAARWMNMVKAFDSSAKEDYLVILGNTNGRDNKYTSFNYHGYLYDYLTSSFKEI